MKKVAVVAALGEVDRLGGALDDDEVRRVLLALCEGRLGRTMYLRRANELLRGMLVKGKGERGRVTSSHFGVIVRRLREVVLVTGRGEGGDCDLRWGRDDVKSP